MESQGKVNTAGFEIFDKSDFHAMKGKECKAVPKSKKLLGFLLAMAQALIESF